MRRFAAAILALGLTLLPSAVLADPCQAPIARSPFAAPDGTPILRATLQNNEARLTYIGHSTFTIESSQGVIAATDYNDYVRPRVAPTIATMNHAHSTHFTYRPDPAIKHVLRGWMHQGRMPSFDLYEKDMRVRNVPTNIRAGWGEGGGTEFSGNSIFIFEVAGMCIAHLGHLHHTLTTEHLAAIGKVDVALVPVDGSWTMDIGGMIEVIGQLSPRIVVPMHFFSERTLSAFLGSMRQTHQIDMVPGPSMILSIATLPEKPTVRVLQGR